MSAITAARLRALRDAVVNARPSDRPAAAGALLDAIRKTPRPVRWWAWLRDRRRYNTAQERVLRDATAAEWLARRAWAREHR